MLVRAFDDRDAVLGVLLREFQQRRRHQEAARERHGADHGASRFAAAQRVNLGARLRDLREGEPRAPRQLLRLARRRDAEARLLEQRHADQALELARGAVHARLRHVLRARGEAEVAVLDHGAERVQVRGAHEPSRVEIEIAREPRVNSATASRRWLMERSMRRAHSSPAGVSATPALLRVSKRGAEVALHAGNGLRYGGLRDVHRPRGGTDAAEPRNFAKCMQMPEIDRRHDGRSYSIYSNFLYPGRISN